VQRGSDLEAELGRHEPVGGAVPFGEASVE
jgi:hypothetical protein